MPPRHGRRPSSGPRDMESVERLVRLAALSAKCESATLVSASLHMVASFGTGMAMDSSVSEDGSPLGRVLESELDLPDARLDQAAACWPPVVEGTVCSFAGLPLRCRQSHSLLGLIAVFSSTPRAAPYGGAELEALRLIADALAEQLAAVPGPRDAGGQAAAAAEGASASASAALATAGLPTAAPAFASVVMENALEMISIHDLSPEGRYLYVSPACTSLLGYSPEDMLGKPVNHFFHPEVHHPSARRVAESAAPTESVARRVEEGGSARCPAPPTASSHPHSHACGLRTIPPHDPARGRRSRRIVSCTTRCFTSARRTKSWSAGETPSGCARQKALICGSSSLLVSRRSPTSPCCCVSRETTRPSALSSTSCESRYASTRRWRSTRPTS